LAVSPPYDLLELRPEGELVTRVLAVEQGPIPVTPRDGRPPKVVQAIRLTVPPEDKQTAPYYWDVTAQTVLPTLREVAIIAIGSKRWIRLHKYGSGVGARFGVELLPADFAGPPRADTMNQAGP